MEYKITYYAAKVWLSSVMIAPTLLFIIALFKYKEADIDIFFIAIISGGVISLPCFLFLYFICKYILKLTTNIRTIKLILVPVGILLTYMPFLIIDNFNFLLDNDLLSQSFFISYCVVIIAGILFYRLDFISPIEKATLDGQINSNNQ